MSLLNDQIEHQIQATAQPIKSLAEGNGPVWLEESGHINEPLLVTLLVDKYGLQRTGTRIEDRDGTPVFQYTLKKYIAEEIGPFIPSGISRRVDPIYKLMRSYIPEKKTALTLNAFTAADLGGADLPATPFAVEKILPCGLTILAAPPKTGKSWLCLALADAVASGSTFWGYNVTAGSVLYMALEDSKARLQKRLRAIGSRMTENLHMVVRNTMTLDTGLINQLSSWIMEHPDTRLIILDTLQRVKGASRSGGNAYEMDYDRIGPLQELATEKNVAIVAVHHLRKQGNYSEDDVFERVSGSTGIFGASDAAWVIYGKRGAEEMTLSLTGRDVFSDEFKIKFDKDKSRWVMLGNSEQLEAQRRADEYATSPLVRTIRELVKESGGRWIGSATMLRSEIVKRTQTVPAECGREFFRMIIDQEELLLKNDKITFSHGSGGRNGRDYTFETVRQMKV